MKKILFMMVVCVFSLTMYAQTYKLGDYVEKDGVPSIVVYVDQTGEHGLLMSMKARVLAEAELPKIDKLNKEQRESMVYMVDARYKFFHLKHATEKGPEAIAHLDSMYKIQIEMIDRYLAMTPLIHTKQFLNMKLKQRKQVLESIKGSTTGSGKENMKLIFDYCTEHGLSVQDYFPQFYWASTLGNGWFIPGNDELELLAQNAFFSEIGYDRGIKVEKWKTDKEMYSALSVLFEKCAYLLRNVSIGLDCQFYQQFNMDLLWPLGCIASSTMAASSWTDDNWDKVFTNEKMKQTELLQYCKGCNNFYTLGLWQKRWDLHYFFNAYTADENIAIGKIMAMCEF